MLTKPPITGTDNFRQRVIHIIAAIPYGCVVTYGDVARLAGSVRASRQVGGIMKNLPPGSLLPWHRVINRKGEISLTGADRERQKSALLAEGIIFTDEGKIDLEIFRWRYESAQ
ncbi:MULTISPECIES: MGMT family protein [Dickeya]|uniref:Excision repair protein alkyltransferase-like protein ATL binds and enhances nucleotide excision repair of O(6)-alkylguanine DNA-binding protein n=1 Tax=Dickeya aquatica TaxID=1401087 RepID=A0A375AEF6_9GAMM|nr:MULTISPECIES: MGMT family protein [Dickeya]SLM63969.1 Excision repair protein; alkyltransferase-like protein ATL; binds and enhances nucleotide excision repair of O(6)-alkylguanine; DNA-binding protein [Dickeya aquatica]